MDGDNMQQTLYWFIIMIGAFIIMFIIVPPKLVPELSKFGFYFGLVFALIILGIGQGLLNLFTLVGDPTFLGIPLITSVLWIPPTIVFAYFFSFTYELYQRIILIVSFATGTAAFQYLLKEFDMWESRLWSPIYTFLLAILTHSLMTAYLLLNKKKI
jgi:hypothetical protein